jgi:serine/threonine-protein kinase
MQSDADRWRRLEDLFHAALECVPESRAAFLETSCEGDTALRHDIEELLAAYQHGGFTESPGFQDGVLLLERAQALTGRRVGQYQILGEIGRGGMGSVYSAVRADDAFQKRVAIKILRRGLDTDDIIDRFRSERQILATLEHPNITRLLDGGSTDDGLPYFVMELIEGEPIDQYCDRRTLTITGRLKLFQGVCAAVRYAHQHLVIHRDIKPGNVLVTTEGVPRLLDFGIAKLLAPGTSVDRTMTALRPLTPEYASPEQVRGAAVTTASDVYSLGVLLYVLLTGCRPYRGDMATPAEVERAICEEEPERPSLAVMKGEGDASRAREGTPEKLRRRLQGDLDNIALMALRKEPQRRYGSAEQLSEDISRHLTNLPVIARADTRGYRTAKFIQRNRTWVAAAAALFLTLAGGIVATMWQARVAREQRDVARVEQAKAARINAFLQEMIGYSGGTTPGSPKRAKGRDATVIDMLNDAAERVETELEDQLEVKAEMLSTIGNTYSTLANYDASRRYLREAYDLDLKVYGPDRLETAVTMYRMAILSYLTGDYAAAETWMQKAAPIYRSHANDADFELWQLPGLLSDAGFVMRARGRLDDAEALWREALTYGPRVDAKHRGLAIIPKTYLAQLYVERGDVERADPLASEATRELRALGNPFPLAQALIDLGNIRRFQRRYKEADALIGEGTTLYAHSQGEVHPNVAYGLHMLATSRYYEGEYDLAEQDARRAMDIVEKLRLKGTNYFAAVAGVLGRILDKTGRSREAETLLREVLEIQRQKGVRPIDRAIAAGILGECLMTEKRYAEAEPLLVESYQTLESVHVPQSPVLREASQRLTSLYAVWDKGKR